MLFALLALAQVRIGTTSAEFSSRVTCVAVSPDGRTLVLARQNGAVELWDVATRARSRELLEAHNKEYGPTPDAALFHSDGKSVFVAGGLFGVRRWAIEGGAPIWHEEGAKDPLALAPDSRSLAFGVGYKGGLRVWSLVERRLAKDLEGHKQTLNSLAYSPDGKHLYSASGDRTTRAWDVATGKELWRLGDETAQRAIGPSFPHCLSLSPDGRRLAVSHHGCWELGLDIVDVEKGAVVAKGAIGNSDAIAFHPKEGLLALQGGDDHVYLWDAEKSRRVSRSPAPHQGRIFGMAWMPDGSGVLTAGDRGLVLLWTLASFEPLK